MQCSYPPPADESTFERLCLRLLQEEWCNPQLQLYGRRGQRQSGIDILDLSAASPSRAAQCKLRSTPKGITVREIKEEIEKVKASSLSIQRYYILTSARRSTDVQQEVRRINQEHKNSGLFEVELWAWEDIGYVLQKHPKICVEFYKSIPGQFGEELGKKMDELTGTFKRFEQRIIGSEPSPQDQAPPSDEEGAKRPVMPSLVTDFSSNDEVCYELASLVVRNRLVVVLGDVLDRGVALTRETLAERLSQEAGLSLWDSYRAGSRIEATKGRVALVDYALGELRGVSGSPTLPYQHLADLPIKSIVSLYPDPVLEMVLVGRERGYQSVVTDDDLAVLDLEPGKKELYLLGGSVRFGTGLVLTMQDHESLLQRVKYLTRRLRDCLAMRDILLIGCNLADAEFRKLFAWITRHRTRYDGRIFMCGCAGPDMLWGSCETVLVNMDPPSLLREVSHRSSRSLQDTPTPPIPTGIIDRWPYKYLDYYEAEDQHFFRGREEETRRFSAEIRSAPRRVTILCGRSGVGKTSLTKAGLIPFLERDSNVVASYTRCGEDPERSIAQAVRSRCGLDESTTAETSFQLARDLREISERDSRLQIVFIDQMEEAFIKLGGATLAGFASALEECLSDPASTSRFVFVIREDFFARMALLSEMLQGLLANPCRLGDLDRDAAREAILEPARLCGIRVEEGLVEAILDDLSPDKVLPAHLQIVCDRVFRACVAERLMTLEAYHGLGRASSILRDHLKESMAGIPDDLAKAARSVLAALVTSEHTKDVLTIEQIAARAGLDLATATDASHDLIHRCRLVREVRGTVGSFELSHESLAESVAVWLTSVQKHIRVLQDLLDQEVSVAKKQVGYTVPLDRLKLIDKHPGSLYFTREALKLVLASWFVRGDIPDYWRAKLTTLEPQEVTEAFLIRPLGSNSLSLGEAMRRLNSLGLQAAPPSATTPDMESAITSWLRHASCEEMCTGVWLLNALNSPQIQDALLHRMVDLTPGEISKFISVIDKQLGISVIECVGGTDVTSISAKTLPFLVARLVRAAVDWDAKEQVLYQALHALKLLLQSASVEQRDLAHAEAARLVRVLPGRSQSMIDVHEIDRDSVLRSVFGADDALADAGIEFLVASKAGAQIKSILCDLNKVSEPRRAAIEAEFKASGSFAAKLVATAIAETVPSRALLELACTLFGYYYHGPKGAKGSAQTVRNGLLAFANTDSATRIPTIAQVFAAMRAPDLAAVFIESLPVLGPDSAKAFLRREWKDWGRIATAVLARCRDTHVCRHVLTQFSKRIVETSTRDIVALIRLGEPATSSIVRSIAFRLDEFHRPPHELKSIADALAELSPKFGTIETLLAIWLRIKFGNHRISDSMLREGITALLFGDHANSLGTLTVGYQSILIETVNHWLTRTGGLGTLDVQTRGGLIAAFRVFRDRSKQLDKLLGELFSTDLAAISDSLRSGSVDEQLALVDCLLMSSHPLSEEIHSLTLQLSSRGDALLRAKASHLLVRRWHDVEGFKIATSLIKRKGRGKLIGEALYICGDAIREHLPRLSNSEIRSALSEKSIAHLVLPELIKSHGRILLEDEITIKDMLRTLVGMQECDASDLRKELVQSLPEVVEVLRQQLAKGLKGRKGNLEYQGHKIIKAADQYHEQ